MARNEVREDQETPYTRTGSYIWEHVSYQTLTFVLNLNLYHFYDRRAGEGRPRMVVRRVLTKQSEPSHDD